MSEKKNICITINSLAPGGAEKQSLLLAKALKHLHNTTVIIVNPYPIYEPNVAVIEKEELKHIFLSKNPIKKILGLTSFLKKEKVDIIFSFLPTDTIWAAIGGKVTGIPYIFGGIRNSHIAYVKYAALRFVHNHMVDYTIANNFAAYRTAIEFGFKKSILVVSNGIEIRPIKQNRKLDTKSITIISVGRLVKQKRYETALKAIAELKNMLKSKYVLQYMIIGDGPEAETIVTAIKKHNLQKEVQIITDPLNIYSLLETSDIYLCTSTFEGISNSIMEAMNCALPIVATDVGDNSRLVLDGKNGLLATIDAYKEIAQHLGSLIESPSIRKQMGLASHNHLVENFGYDAFQKKYLNIIGNVGSLQIQDGQLRLQE